MMPSTSKTRPNSSFGLAFLGDDATIHQMALINILAMSGVLPPMPISIQDFTKHLAEGGKKDASYIMICLTRRDGIQSPEDMY
jgi:hypothetical protein